MGTYTYFRCKIKLRKDTPQSVQNLLTTILVNEPTEIEYHHEVYGKITGFATGETVLVSSDYIHRLGINHPFFECERWLMLFNSTNWSDLKGGYLDTKKEYWLIELETEFKNHDEEITKFFDWIAPYVAGRKKKQYLGFSKIEGSNTQWHRWVDCSIEPHKIID